MTTPAERSNGKPAHRPLPGTGLMLFLAHRMANQSFGDALRAHNIEPQHFGVLMQLAEAEPLSQRELVERLGRDRSGMVRSLDELEQRGLVRRRPSPDDRRANAVTLTARGRRLHAVAAEVARETAGRMFAVLSEAEHRELNRLLAKLVYDREED